MKHIIIGTAGHVDHGKTALIKSLTGTDTDRLKEEKQRGISIDLGFAALDLGQNMQAGIVDVPGHERFLKNMLAGTGGMDMVILVIAADEGVMPQTREHLAMLALYGVHYGVVAITKIDKVAEDWLQLVEEDIRTLLEGTFLAEAPFCRVSAVSGEGLDALRATITAVAAVIPGRDSEAPFHMWVDRTFVIKGYGLVATGSVLTGKVIVGESLALLPGGEVLRVRGLQSHGNKVEALVAGQRAAINVAGTNLPTIERGMAFSAPGHGQVATLWDVAIHWHQEAPNGARIRLHIGTAEYLGRLYQFKGQAGNLRRLLLEKPLAAGAGDRGILRLYSPQLLLGGVLLIAPGNLSRRLPPYTAQLAAAQAVQDLECIVCLLPARAGRMLSQSEIHRQAGYYPEEAIRRCLQAALATGELVKIVDSFSTTTFIETLTIRMQELLQEYHRQQPDRDGLPREVVRQKLGLTEKEFEVLQMGWQDRGLITLCGVAIALPTHAGKHCDWRHELIAQMEEKFNEMEFTTITSSLLEEKLQLSADRARAAQEVLLASGVLLRVGELVVYRKTIQYIAKVIQQHFVEKTTLTVAELRDKLNTSRKFVMPVLEYFDMHKYTVRDGDVRLKGQAVRDLSE